MKRTDSDYLRGTYSADSDVKVEMLQRRIVRVRKAQTCWLCRKQISVGALALFEKAKVEGCHWGRSYLCQPCMDSALDEAIA